MRLSALRHLTDAVRSLAQSREVRILGSSALLASFPELGESGDPIETSFDADLIVTPCDERLAAMLHEALGEGSLFAERTGYHVDILRPDIVEMLPPGWEARLVRMEGPGDIAALAPEDVLVAKLRVGREKDLTLCRWLFEKGKVDPRAVRSRLGVTPMPEAEVVRTHRRLDSCLGGGRDVTAP